MNRDQVALALMDRLRTSGAFEEWCKNVDKTELRLTLRPLAQTVEDIARRRFLVLGEVLAEADRPPIRFLLGVLDGDPERG